MQGSRVFDTDELIKEIQTIFHQIDKSDLTDEEAVDIATDLYPIEPALAFMLLKENMGSDSEETSFELAIAQVTLASLKHQQLPQSNENRRSSSPVPKDVLINKKLRQLLDATSLFRQATSAADVLRGLETLADEEARLFVERRWISHHPFRNDVLDIVEIALSDAIGNPAYSPNASFYREVATPLPYANDRKRANKIAQILEGQTALISERGPTVDYLRLQVCLAKFAFENGQINKGLLLLEGLCLECIEESQDHETRIASLAWLLGGLTVIDPDQELRKTHFRLSSVWELVVDHLEFAVDKVLSHGADQLETLRGALEALSTHCTQRAIEISKRLNTSNRRSAALLHVIVSICRSRVSRPDPELVFQALRCIDDQDMADEALLVIVKRLCDDVISNEIDISVLMAVENLLPCASSSRTRSESAAYVIAACGKLGLRTHWVTTLGKRLLEEFEKIIDPTAKYRTACNLIVRLKTNSPELARQIFAYLTERSPTSMFGEDVEDARIQAIDLLVKATFALSETGALPEPKLREVVRLISMIGDPVRAIAALSKLAFYLWKKGLTEWFSEIVNHEIWPSLGRLEESDLTSLFRAWEFAYGVVWLDDTHRARDAIKSLPEFVQDDCISKLIWQLLYKLPTGEPLSDTTRMKTRLKYTDMQSLLSLCEETQEDFTIYGVFERIATEISLSHSRVNITREQRAEISRRMRHIAKTRLPMPNQIQHNGYQIVCLAQALRVSKASDGEWKKLCKQCSALENRADRAYVQAVLATWVPARQTKMRNDLFADAQTITGRLGSLADRYDRYLLLADCLTDKDKKKAGKALRNAYKTALCPDISNRNSKERQIVDMAYRIDPNLPLELSILHDSDPSKEKFKERAQKQIRRNKLRENLLDLRKHIDVDSLQSEPGLSGAAWKALGSLNAGRAAPIDIDRCRDMLVCASATSLEDAFPLYSWVISSVMGKYATSKESSKYIGQIFDGVLSGIKFLNFLIDGDSAIESAPKWQDVAEPPDGIVVLHGQRSKAVSFIRDWLQSYSNEVVTIVDPYFGLDELEFVEMIMDIDSELRIRVLTSKSHNQNFGDNLPESYATEWRRRRDQLPPITEVLLVGSVNSGQAPFHDRWILSGDSGIRLGSSLNSFGNRDSEISVGRSDQVLEMNKRIDQYFTKGIRQWRGETVSYQGFDLAM